MYVPDDERMLAIQVMAMPRDTNAHGTIFGGFILSLIDQAGAIRAHAGGAGKVVTVAMQRVEFTEPVLVGDLVTCRGWVVSRGRTSITVCVQVTARLATAADAEPRDVTQAEVKYVQVDERGKPLPLGGRPPVA